MPDIDENGVLLKMKAVGICHSDYELLAGRYIIPISYPVSAWAAQVVRRGRRGQAYRSRGLPAGGDRVPGPANAWSAELPDRLRHFGFSLEHGATGSTFRSSPESLRKLPDAPSSDKQAAR